jgi:hypothetical protein
MTNHIIIRGMYEKITLCVYGLPYTGTEGHLLLEAAKNDVPLEKLQNLDESDHEDRLNLTNDDIELLNTHTIDSLISPYIKCEILGGLKKAYFINPPNLNMVEKTKTGYIYYENDLNYYSQSLYNFYLNEHKSNRNNKYPINISNNHLEPNEGMLDSTTFLTYFKKISDIVKILIANNFAFLEDDCVFSTNNYEIFHKMPEIIMDVIIFSLDGNLIGYTEVNWGLKLLKIMSNSSHFTNLFVEKSGFERLYSILLNKDSNMIIRALVLENIYKLITHKKAFSKLMESIDKTKLPQQYFMIKEGTTSSKETDITVESNGNYKEEKTVKKKDKEKRDRSRERDRGEKKKSKKKSKRERRNKSQSRSRSPRERSRSHISKDSVKSSDNSGKGKYSSKKQAKNVPLKNGYQIILTLLIGKKNYLLISIIKKLINKVSLLLSLKEFGLFMDKIVN